MTNGVEIKYLFCCLHSRGISTSSKFLNNSKFSLLLKFHIDLFIIFLKEKKMSRENSYNFFEKYSFESKRKTDLLGEKKQFRLSDHKLYFNYCFDYFLNIFSSFEIFFLLV